MALMGRGYQLAQVNIARMRAPINDPVMAEFVAQLAEINALADQSDGFTWRLQSEGAADATALTPFDDPLIIINMSVWLSIEALRRFAYHGMHHEALRRRESWFQRFEGAYQALWWVEAGHRPNVGEGKERLHHLRTHGESAEAFSFGAILPPPEARGAP